MEITPTDVVALAVALAHALERENALLAALVSSRAREAPPEASPGPVEP